MKQCKGCNEFKEIDAFAKVYNKQYQKYYVRGKCISCYKEYNAEYYVKHKDKLNLQMREYHQNNKEANNRLSREWYANKRKDAEWVSAERARIQEHRKNNLGKYAAKEAKRRAAKMKRTAPWADLDYIKDLYTNAQEANEVFKDYGIVFHIDHEIPLQGELVSGLHVENNLQVLSAYDNLSKSNRYEVN